MGLFDFWKGRPSSSENEATSPRAATQSADGGVLIQTPDQLDEYLRGAGASGAGVVVNADTAMRVASVFACVRIIAGAVATMPLQLKRRTGPNTREDASDHPLHQVLSRRPNRWMTPSGFRRMLQAHLLLRGNAYALKVPNARGEVTALLPLHPDRTSSDQLDDMSIVYRYRTKAGAERIFRQDEIFHLIGLTLDGVNGVSVITYARETIGLSAAISRHGSTFFKNGTNPGAVLRAKNKLGPEGVETLQQSLASYRGADNANKTLVLEEDMEFEHIGMSATDAQFVEAIGATRTDIAMFFGVPPHMLGDTAKSTSWGSGIEQQSIGFVAYTLEDWLTGWEQTIGRDLIADKETDLFARYNRAGLVRGDIKTRYGAYAVGRQWGWLSANDVRELEDMNPVEGGDAYLVPLNMVDWTKNIAADDEKDPDE